MRFILYAAVASIISACGDHKKNKSPETDPVIVPIPAKPAWAGNCDVDYSSLRIENIEANDVLLDDRGIEEKAKIVRLNELNGLPANFLRMFGDSRVPFKMINGGVSNFEELSHLKGKLLNPDQSGYTFDQLGGLTAPQGVFMGTTAHGANSVSIHEGGHVIDQLIDLSQKSSILHNLFSFYATRPANGDSIANFRLSDKAEFFATGFDDYYCSTSSRMKLLKQYPRMHEYFSKMFDEELAQFPVKIVFDSQKQGRI